MWYVWEGRRGGRESKCSMIYLAVWQLLSAVWILECFSIEQMLSLKSL